MDIVFGLALTLLGGILGWWTTRHYSQRGSDELRELVAKLPTKVVEALREDQRNNLTVKQLNELLRKITVDEATGAIKACPRCGSKNVTHTSDADVDADYNDGEVSYSLNAYVDIDECEDCRWARSVYTSPRGDGEVFDIHVSEPAGDESRGEEAFNKPERP